MAHPMALQKAVDGEAPISTFTTAQAAGLEPEARNTAPGGRDGFIIAVAVVLVVVLFNMNRIRKLLGIYADELFRIRRGRDNVFDEVKASSAGAGIIFVILFVVCAGFLLSSAETSYFMPWSVSVSTPLVLMDIGIVAIYYIVMVSAYKIVGYTFADEEGSREWVRGFRASVALTSLGLLMVSLVVLFSPSSVRTMAVLALILFIIGKIAFILKGFRIFYDNFFSLLYFILYLCTLEIIPIILVYNCSVQLL